MDWLKELNDEQRAAVLYDDAHLLIVAGPGTGKTRTLTCRIARLVGTLGAGQKVLAVTFTNKAADEMRERLEKLDVELDGCAQVGTFHSFSLALLREYRERLLFPLNFSIVTPDEVEELAAEFLPKSSRRERRVLLKDVAAWKASFEPASVDQRVNTFRTFLRERGLVDFDDILRDAVLLLRDNPDIAAEVRRRYPLVLVDEYQDVSAVQVELLKLLACDGVRLTVIGDPNQAIYGFRGSDVRFFEDFGTTFAPAERIGLGENYRSAGNLLEASGQVIRAGARFSVPELTAAIHAKGLLGNHEAASDRAEAIFVANEITKLIGGSGHHAHDIDGIGAGAGYSFGDIAVLFRLNVQSRSLEESFLKSGIPFQTAGVRPAGLSLQSRKALRDIADVAILPFALEKLRGDDEALAADWERVTALAKDARSVTDFLDRLSLETPEDAYSTKAEKVAFLTLHAAKGLEFSVVFIVGCEEGLLPLAVDFLDTDLEEERRLFYVGMTRAKEQLYFVRAKKRTLFGRALMLPPSKFLSDIEEELASHAARPLSRRALRERQNTADLFRPGS